jgi:RNA polymerase sigma-70 factor (ECF subfamily)
MSVADAEDMLQETFIRWQQAHKKEIRSPRAFLVTIISRLSINHLQSARVQREEYFGEWLPEPIVTGMGSDPLELIRLDESLSMAFLVMLERLTPVERAVFLLREIFDYEYPEIATLLGESEVNCRQTHFATESSMCAGTCGHPNRFSIPTLCATGRIYYRKIAWPQIGLRPQ